MDRTESDSPRRELSNGGLKGVVTLLVCWQINYSCASPRKAIQLYFVWSILTSFQTNFPDNVQRKILTAEFGFALLNTLVPSSRVLMRCLGLYWNYV